MNEKVAGWWLGTNQNLRGNLAGFWVFLVSEKLSAPFIQLARILLAPYFSSKNCIRPPFFLPINFWPLFLKKSFQRMTETQITDY